MADLWKRSVTIVASLNIPIIVYFFVIAEILFAVIYTEKYIESATYFRLFIIVYLSSIFLRGVILRASDKTKYLFYIDLFCFPLTIIFSYILIRQYGMVGAVLTAIIGEILPITIRLLIEVRLLNLRFIEWLEWNKLLLVLISSCAPLPFIYLLMNYLSNQYVILLFSGAFYFIGVIIIQYLLGIFMFEKELMAFRNTIFSKLGL